MRMELRCCCNAGLLLGSVEVPLQAAIDGRITYELVSAPFESVNLDVAPLYSFGRAPRLAVKSMDHPIEVLRRIPSFEAP